MQTVTLIIDKRKEISIKYKKLLHDKYSTVLISKNLISAMKIIQDKEPDLIIISDSMGTDLDSYCKEIRALTYSMRPIIIATSKSSDISDKLKILESGADDYISEPINSKEFVMRIKAHLRREFESNLDDKNMLPNKNYSLRAIKRALTSEENQAVFLITIDNFQIYREVYTKLASDKLVQTYSAIIASTLNSDDFLGKFSENEFLVIADSEKSEKLANFLTFAFDTVAEKFYSASDITRGFLITQGNSLAGMRAEFVHSTIGIINTNNHNYKEVQELLTDLINIRNLAKLPTKSNYLIERTKLEAKDSVTKSSYNNEILIIEEDEAMSLLLTTILDMQGYKTKTVPDFKLADFNTVPAVIILDTGNNETQKGLQLCKIIKDSHLLNNSKLIVTSVFHDKETVLKNGADLYLPKPYDMPELVKWVEKFINNFNQF